MALNSKDVLLINIPAIVGTRNFAYPTGIARIAKSLSISGISFDLLDLNTSTQAPNTKPQKVQEMVS